MAGKGLAWHVTCFPPQSSRTNHRGWFALLFGVSFLLGLIMTKWTCDNSYASSIATINKFSGDLIPSISHIQVTDRSFCKLWRVERGLAADLVSFALAVRICGAAKREVADQLFIVSKHFPTIAKK